MFLSSQDRATINVDMDADHIHDKKIHRSVTLFHKIKYCTFEKAKRTSEGFRDFSSYLRIDIMKYSCRDFC
jgi:hypothetical protein